MIKIDPRWLPAERPRSVLRKAAAFVSLALLAVSSLGTAALLGQVGGSAALTGMLCAGLVAVVLSVIFIRSTVRLLCLAVQAAGGRMLRSRLGRQLRARIAESPNGATGGETGRYESRPPWKTLW